MTLQGLAHIGEFIGGIAIIISLAYLAIQVSDSNRLLRSQAHYNALVLAQAPCSALGSGAINCWPRPNLQGKRGR